MLQQSEWSLERPLLRLRARQLQLEAAARSVRRIAYGPLQNLSRRPTCAMVKSRTPGTPSVLLGFLAFFLLRIGLVGT